MFHDKGSWVKKGGASFQEKGRWESLKGIEGGESRKQRASPRKMDCGGRTIIYLGENSGRSLLKEFLRATGGADWGKIINVEYLSRVTISRRSMGRRRYEFLQRKGRIIV